MSGRIKVSPKFNQLDRRIKEAKEKALQEYARAELRETQRRILVTKTDPAGQAWAPWSFRTMLQRVREGSAGLGILNRTGRLLRSISARVSGDSVTISSNADYARYHQEGTPRTPARPFINVNTPGSIQRMKDALKKYMSKL